jgi:glycosyltransferase involved in cell wall biosynthesis
MNVALCEPMTAHLRGRGVPAERLAVIPNWADGELISPIPPDENPLRREWGLEGRRAIGYSGNLGRAHDLPVVQSFVAAMAAADPELVFLFIGGGAGTAALRDWAIAQGLGARVQFRQHQPRQRLAQGLSVPDAHIVSLDPACEGLLMPSKLAGILAAGRPVIALGDPGGAVAREVHRLDSGIVWRPGREREVLALLDRARDPTRIARLRAAFEVEFDRAGALAAWERILPEPPERRPVGRLATAEPGA